MIGKAKVTFSWVSEIVGDEEGSKDFYVRLSPRIKEGPVHFSEADMTRLGINIVKKMCENSSGLKEVELKANK
jgi:hypothetical protein